MYKKSEHPCPKCFRLLRIKLSNKVFYCPDTFTCGWYNHCQRPPQKLSQSDLEHQLKEARENNQHQLAKRIKACLIQCYPHSHGSLA